MDYNKLEKTYFSKVEERVYANVDKVVNETTLSTGNTIPDENDLPIGSGRRMSMAVLFLDICNFSSRQSESEVEQLAIMRWLNLFFSEMINIAEEYGGVVEKNTGDGLMAYFSDANFGGENGTKRAVACSLTMFEVSEKVINPLIANTWLGKIDFRISIDHGNVTIAKLGKARRFNSYVAIGTTANFASKMLKFADPNEIVLGETAKLALPLSWQSSFVKLKTENTGWNFRVNSKPYLLYKYTGRWNRDF